MKPRVSEAAAVAAAFASATASSYPSLPSSIPRVVGNSQIALFEKQVRRENQEATAGKREQGSVVLPCIVSFSLIYKFSV